VRFLASGLRGAGVALLLVAGFSGFSGCNGSNPVTILPTPTPTPARSSTSTATVGATGTTISFPTVLSQSGGFTLPAASAGSGATLTGTFSVDPPSGVAAIQSGLRSPQSASIAPAAGPGPQATTTTQHTGIAYITFTVSAAVTVSGTFHVTFTGTTAPAATAFIAYYDGTAWQYDILSTPSTATANTLDFSAKTTAPLSFVTGKTYVFALTTDVTSTPPPITGG